MQSPSNTTTTTTTTTSTNNDHSIREYMSTLSDLEKKACEIAKDHLESSFDLSKSNGYKVWMQNKSAAA